MIIRRARPEPMTIAAIESLARHQVANVLSMPGMTIALVRAQIASEDGFGGWSPTWAAHRHEATCPSHEAIRTAYNVAATVFLDTQGAK